MHSEVSVWLRVSAVIQMGLNRGRGVRVGQPLIASRPPASLQMGLGGIGMAVVSQGKPTEGAGVWQTWPSGGQHTAVGSLHPPTAELCLRPPWEEALD